MRSVYNYRMECNDLTSDNGCIRVGGDGDHHRPIRGERGEDLANRRQTPEKGSQTESELIICNSISSLISNLAFFSPAGVRLN